MTSPNTPEQDRILARVRKMMRLAEDAAATDGERDNALRMAHATLLKHNLTMAAAEAAGQAPEESRERGSTTSRDQPWCRSVAHAVSKLFFCAYWFSKTAKRGTVKHNYVGLAGNVATAQAMTDYVIRSIMSEANRRWKHEPNPGAWWTSFCKGAAQRIHERCEALRTEAEKPESTGTALVVVSLYESESAKNKLVVRGLGLSFRVPTGRTKKRVLTDGFSAGREFGGTVSLSRQVGSSAAPAARRLS